jgi:hypothetical protein
MNRRILIAVAVILLLGAVAFAYQSLAAPHIETYTVGIAGVVAAQDADGVTIDGQASKVHVTSMITGGAPLVGDVLLAGGEGSSWGYAARPAEAGCWRVGGQGRVDGDWVEVDVGQPVGRPGTDIHLRIPISPDFKSPLASDGHLLGQALCLDRTGKVISAS